MRIISGTARGRRLYTPRNSRVRPTADRVKEAIFNIIGNMIGSYQEIRVLDIFAGTGNLGIEALSRGAGSAVFIENHRDSVALITNNLKLTNFEAISRIVTKNASAALELLSLEGQPFHLIFLDPPYEQGLTEQTLKALESSPLIDDRTIVVAEFSIRENIPSSFGGLHEMDRRTYGDTVISLFVANGNDSLLQ